ncbi:aprA [Symbiodinium microadriaticum]|nr:aprA [Symbiodinium microadriaticum]
MEVWATMDDPFTYLARLTMPKLVVNAGLDEFQMPEDSHHWWSTLPEPKHFLMTPNADHSEATGLLEIIPAMGTWMRYLLQQRKVPTFSWDIDSVDGTITAVLDSIPQHRVYEASVWYAYSCGVNPDGIQRRDFRLVSLDVPCDCGKHGYDGYCVNLKSGWTRVLLNETVSTNGKRTYVAHVDAPGDGRYVAYLIDLKYDTQPPVTGREDLMGVPTDLPGRLEFTTEVSIFPNTYPYEDCEGSGCRGTLV